MAALKTLKKELRQRIKLVLSELEPESITSQTSNAVETLLSMPEYKAAKRISIYLSMPSGEISTSGIVHDALKQGKKVFIPYTYKMANPREGQPKSIMDMLELTSMNDFASLNPDGWGIPSLDKDSISQRENSFGGKGITDGSFEGWNEADSGLDLIVMPGMAFDSSLGRLGHGKGFYDFFLERCQTHSMETTARKPFLVGLALAEQLLPVKESVPMDTTDWRLNALVLGTGKLLRKADPS
ncbi:5-formyltetrahydrofolate cyclo-ligase-like protein [Mytilinidion resinicola]|uniref:5-formyltetrahydrofolate cyclo-ligase n=1 Tax=Mytilinidion resinicola TaxID=574789 RepID=A0A6A6Y9W1_9PEZI|nr:5-formyltetrahydrofolate cyclo-ligase-like protein [Mytilinidion resinicola]KAF2805490.1 5-formyltetrahydrofolate cyclo-ligase-like protein [Mytilinidion resinicola]